MSKQFWKGSALLAPVPAALVTCGTIENPNVLTIGWTGIVCTRPPMTYISVRPERFLTISSRLPANLLSILQLRQCAVKRTSAELKAEKDTDKISSCGFHLVPANKVAVPLIEECPVSLECRVVKSELLGSHTMFLAEIVGIDADEKYIDSKGKLNLQQCGLMAYAHGEYFALGRKLGDFGFSVRRKKKKRK